MNEIWKVVEDYPDYMISDFGRVKKLNYRKSGKDKILKPLKDRYGYLTVNLYKNKKMKHRTIHRLVAQAFIPNPDEKPQVNHIDGDKQNNNRLNLEWVTGSENQQHALNNGLRYGYMKGKVHSEETKCKIREKRLGTKHDINTKLKIGESSKKKVICLNTNEIFDSVKSAATRYGIDKTGISRCCRGGCNSAGKHPITKEKLVWKYID